MAPKTTPTQPKARGRNAKGPTNVGPVAGPAGNTRSRRGNDGAVGLTPGLSYFPTRTRNGRVTKSRAPKKVAGSVSKPAPPAPTPRPASETTLEPSQIQATNSSAPGPVVQQSAQEASRETAPQTPLHQHPATASRPVDGAAPAVKTGAAAPGTGSSSKRASSQQQRSGSSSGGSKRPTGDEGNDRKGDSKKSRGDGPGSRGATGNQQATRTGAPTLNNCEIAAAAIARFEEMANAAGTFGSIEEPVEAGEYMTNTTVFRAVAAVSEAISQSGSGVEFSLIEDTTLSVAANSAVDQPTTRPGNEVLIPWCPGDNHISLYIVRRNGTSNNFHLGHYDSAGRAWHRAPDARTRARNMIPRVLNQTGWNSSGGNAVSVIGVDANRTRQLRNWECGLHSIFSAWAYALGLELAEEAQGTGLIYDEFLRLGGILINMALLGYVDSETIRAFLDCFGFIRVNQTVTLARSFDSTINFATTSVYREHLARLRLEAALSLRRANGENLQSLDSIITQLNDSGFMVESLINVTVQDLLENLNRFGQMGNPGTTQESPVDPDEQILNEIMLAEARERVDARDANAASLAAEASAAAVAGQSSSATSTDNVNVQGSTTGEGQGNAPPTVDGTAGSASQQGTTQRRSTSPGVDPPGGGRNSSDSFSGVGSDDDDDDDDNGFFGGTPLTSIPAVQTSIPESADLIAFREAEARRMNQARAAEARLQATRAQEQAAQAAAAATPATDETANGINHQPEADNPGLGPSQSQVEDPSGLSDDGNNSLFGDSDPALPTQPSTLSLPPSPFRSLFVDQAQNAPPQSSVPQSSLAQETLVEDTAVEDALADDGEDVTGSRGDVIMDGSRVMDNDDVGEN